MSTVIKVENLGKQYRLGEVGTGTLSHDLNRWWARIQGKDDPFAKVGEHNDRTIKGHSEYVWALTDINFEVKSGEILGIIGRNGAGKSTLLKILSKVTKPSTGRILTKGRIASLLEVGTGFHPEMTGRENIFMNGAIMGMTRTEIRKKFDEIVDFAGVERYIDTPVKRYSSGMYVRLAFAVAAHLEPEILVVDEVLAVGDAEFQKKCLGKMKDVSTNKGRTVIFVSHDMSNIQFLCDKTLLLKNGCVDDYDISEKVIPKYLSNKEPIQKRHGTGEIKIANIEIWDKEENIVNQMITNERYVFKVAINSFIGIANISFALCFNNINRTRACSLWTTFNGINYDMEVGKYVLTFEVPSLRLIPGIYELITYIEHKGATIEQIDNYMDIVVVNGNKPKSLITPNLSTGVYLQEFTSCMNKIND